MGNINKKVDKLIAKRQWDKLLLGLKEADGEAKLKIAEACGKAGGSGCIDILSVLLNDPEQDQVLQMTAITSLGVIGNDRCITLLRYFREHVQNEDVIAAVDDAIRQIKVRVAAMEKAMQ